jgi:ABC-type cobalamin transport system permease subunit
MATEGKNPFVGIVGIIAGISVGIVALFVIFAREQVMYAAWIVGALVILGIILGLIAARKTDPRP